MSLLSEDVPALSVAGWLSLFFIWSTNQRPSEDSDLRGDVVRLAVGLLRAAETGDSASCVPLDLEMRLQRLEERIAATGFPPSFRPASALVRLPYTHPLYLLRRTILFNIQEFNAAAEAALKAEKKPLRAPRRRRKKNTGLEID